MSASGMSPVISRTIARDLASFALILASRAASVRANSASSVTIGCS